MASDWPLEIGPMLMQSPLRLASFHLLRCECGYEGIREPNNLERADEAHRKSLATEPQLQQRQRILGHWFKPRTCGERNVQSWMFI